MKRGTPAHIKTKRLARILDVPLYAAAGILECTWHLTVSLAQAGDIGRLDDVEIAQEIDWRGDPGQLVQALVDSGWLDRCRCHRLRVHDWPQHADQTLKRALSNNGNDFLSCYADASSMLASDEQETSCRTKPNQAIAIAKPKPAAEAAPDPASDVLEYFCSKTATALHSPAVREKYLARIKQRMREKFTPQQLKDCVDAALLDAWYVDNNYHKQPEVIWRNAERVQKLLQQGHRPPSRGSPPGPAGGILEQSKRVYERMKAQQEAKKNGEPGSRDGGTDADGSVGTGGAEPEPDGQRTAVASSGVPRGA